jgi:hypothetical protein
MRVEKESLTAEILQTELRNQQYVSGTARAGGGYGEVAMEERDFDYQAPQMQPIM